MFIRIKKLLFGLIVGMTLASCGGGGPQVAEGGIGGTGISTGTVTGFGSIIVNGVHFDTTGAVVMKDEDSPVTNYDDALIDNLVGIGMVVTVKGTINNDGTTGKADTITYRDTVEGPVVGTPSGTTLNVLGQTVHVVDGVTKYACDESYALPCSFTQFSDLVANQVVEVSGFIDENDEITAGYIELQKDSYLVSDEFEIKGFARHVDNDNFTIGGLTITHGYSTTMFDDQFVEAKGVFDGTNTLTAFQVEVEDESFDETDPQLDGYKAELEGIAITACGGGSVPCTFTLSGVTVQVEASTQYSGSGSSASDIIVGTKLEVEGEIVGGQLLAYKIEFE